MKIKLSVLLLILLLTLLNAQSYADGVAVSPAVVQMAEIMHRLKHFPSPQGKATLYTIINHKNATVREKILATAILNLQHKAVGEDIGRLKKVIADAATGDAERKLAVVILNLEHRPTKQDKATLKSIIETK